MELPHESVGILDVLQKPYEINQIKDTDKSVSIDRVVLKTGLDEKTIKQTIQELQQYHKTHHLSDKSVLNEESNNTYSLDSDRIVTFSLTARIFSALYEMTSQDKVKLTDFKEWILEKEADRIERQPEMYLDWVLNWGLSRKAKYFYEPDPGYIEPTERMDNEKAYIQRLIKRDSFEDLLEKIRYYDISLKSIGRDLGILGIQLQLAYPKSTLPTSKNEAIRYIRENPTQLAYFITPYVEGNKIIETSEAVRKLLDHIGIEDVRNQPIRRMYRQIANTFFSDEATREEFLIQQDWLGMLAGEGLYQLPVGRVRSPYVERETHADHIFEDGVFCGTLIQVSEKPISKEAYRRYERSGQLFSPASQELIEMLEERYELLEQYFPLLNLQEPFNTESLVSDSQHSRVHSMGIEEEKLIRELQQMSLKQFEVRISRTTDVKNIKELYVAWVLNKHLGSVIQDSLHKALKVETDATMGFNLVGRKHIQVQWRENQQIKSKTLDQKLEPLRLHTDLIKPKSRSI